MTYRKPGIPDRNGWPAIIGWIIALLLIGGGLYLLTRIIGGWP